MRGTAEVWYFWEGEKDEKGDDMWMFFDVSTFVALEDHLETAGHNDGAHVVWFCSHCGGAFFVGAAN
jgi:hypothetical protein